MNIYNYNHGQTPTGNRDDPDKNSAVNVDGIGDM